MNEEGSLTSFEIDGERAIRTASLSAISTLDQTLLRTKEILMDSKTFSENVMKKRLDLSSKVVNLSESGDRLANTFDFKNSSTLDFKKDLPMSRTEKAPEIHELMFEMSKICKENENLKKSLMSTEDKLKSTESELTIERGVKEFNNKAHKTAEAELSNKLEELYSINCSLKNSLLEKDKIIRSLENSISDLMKNRQELMIENKKQERAIKDLEFNHAIEIESLKEKIKEKCSSAEKDLLERELQSAKDYINSLKSEYSSYFENLKNELERVKKNYADLSAEKESSTFYIDEINSLHQKNSELMQQIRWLEDDKYSRNQEKENMPVEKHYHSRNSSDWASGFSIDLNQSSLMRKDLESKISKTSENFSILKQQFPKKKSSSLIDKVVDTSICDLVQKSRVGLGIPNDFPDLDIIGINSTKNTSKPTPKTRTFSKIYRRSNSSIPCHTCYVQKKSNK
ncbi:unnamed protein product [Blepharisma stoltei]|uniref:Uncharacterized protein n=1 Tax=Blepharisma stoltei TaxID=1481888 RepID=A0AAU9KLL0_9CILI|nr:unnamed protein product [Blepharisma stoltei]